MAHARVLLLLSLLLSLLNPISALSAERRVQYSVSLVGVPVGRAELRVRTDGKGYRIDGTASARGVSRLFSDMALTVGSRGLRGARFTPSSYALNYVEDGEAETVQMTLRPGRPAAVAIQPPDEPHPEDVPLKPAHTKGVLDPLSAIVIEGNAASVCPRRLPVFDGESRFDIVLSPAGTSKVDLGRRSYRGPAIKCSARYVPVAGYRPTKKEVRQMARNKDMHVWFAPLDKGLFVPVRVEVGTPYGKVRAKARRVS